MDLEEWHRKLGHCFSNFIYLYTSIWTNDTYILVNFLIANPRLWFHLFQDRQISRSKSWCIYDYYIPISVCSHVWWLGPWFMLVGCHSILHIPRKETVFSGQHVSACLRVFWILRILQVVYALQFLHFVSSYLDDNSWRTLLLLLGATHCIEVCGRIHYGLQGFMRCYRHVRDLATECLAHPFTHEVYILEVLSRKFATWLIIEIQKITESE